MPKSNTQLSFTSNTALHYNPKGDEQREQDVVNACEESNCMIWQVDACCSCWAKGDTCATA